MREAQNKLKAADTEFDVIKTGVENLDDVVIPEIVKTTCNKGCFDDKGKVKKEYAINVDELYREEKKDKQGHAASASKNGSAAAGKDEGASKAKSSSDPNAKKVIDNTVKDIVSDLKNKKK